MRELTIREVDLLEVSETARWWEERHPESVTPERDHAEPVDWSIRVEARGRDRAADGHVTHQPRGRSVSMKMPY